MSQFDPAAQTLKARSRYFRTFKITQHLWAWIKHGGKCVYCDSDLMASPDALFGSSCTDHLLPRRRYPELVTACLNAVPSCHRCNWLKGHWDPNDASEGALYFQDSSELTDEMHDELVKRARDYVQDRMQMAQHDFDEAKGSWNDVVSDAR